MGMPTANIGQSLQPEGKGSSGQKVTFPSQGGQPQMGMPNTYSNTVGQSTDQTNQPTQIQSGKGKGY